MRRSLRAAAPIVLAASLVGAGCGDDDHPNEPRPPAPIEITAKVDEQGVDISPTEFGAGLVVMTISNQSDEPIQIAVEGPTAGQDSVIAAGSVGNFKFDFKEGTYEVTAGDESRARPAELTVGPPRASSQNELLLP